MQAEMILKMLGIDPQQLLAQISPQIAPVVKKLSDRLDKIEADISAIREILEVQHGRINSE